MAGWPGGTTLTSAALPPTVPHLPRFIFNNVSRGLFEEHKSLYSFLVATSILRHESSGEIAAPEWNFLVRGPAGGLTTAARPAACGWVSEAAWKALAYAEGSIPALEGLAGSVESSSSEWEAWAATAEPHTEPLPSGWEFKLSGSFAKLAVIRIFREEKLIFACSQYVGTKLGGEFTEPAPWTLDDVFPDSSCRTPTIFILSTGADPTAMLQRFAEKKGWTPGERLHMISLGQGQGPIAEMLMAQAAVAGDWVCLQNCHLASSWMLRMEEKVEELSAASNSAVHPDFRLWLTSMPSSVFPVMVLQNSIKLTNEPPKGVRANVARTYNDMTAEHLGSCPAKPEAWRKLLFSLSFFHAVVQERRKFGPIGWNIRYEFNTSDVECSMMTLRMFLTEQDAIPWPALEYVIGQINYGGRVTDDNDRRCLMSVLRKYITPRGLDGDFKLTPSGTYFVPPDGNLDSYREYVKGLPATEAPEVFGMHANANISFQLQETRRLIDTVLSIQPRVATGGVGKGPDEIVGELALSLWRAPLASRSTGKTRVPVCLTAPRPGSSTACRWCWGRRWTASTASRPRWGRACASFRRRSAAWSSCRQSSRQCTTACSPIRCPRCGTSARTRASSRSRAGWPTTTSASRSCAGGWRAACQSASGCPASSSRRAS
jgi:dynein heavy chain